MCKEKIKFKKSRRVKNLYKQIICTILMILIIILKIINNSKRAFKTIYQDQTKNN